MFSIEFSTLAILIEPGIGDARIKFEIYSRNGTPEKPAKIKQVVLRAGMLDRPQDEEIELLGETTLTETTQSFYLNLPFAVESGDQFNLILRWDGDEYSHPCGARSTPERP